MHRTDVNKLLLSKSISGKAKQWAANARSVTEISRIDEDPQVFLLEVLSAPPERRPELQLKGILRWWRQKHLPASGVELAPELKAPDHLFLEVFRRSRVVAFDRGKRLQEEGTQVSHYSIVLFGKCRLRCTRPGPQPNDRTPIASASKSDEELTTNGALDSDGFIHIGEVSRGEPLGLYPGDKSACYEVTCVDKTTMLLLNKDDYEAILKPFQKKLHDNAVDFLQQHKLCPEATRYSLERLVRNFRHRKVRKGKTIMRAGDPHRHVWFLRDGSCTVFLSSETAVEALDHATDVAHEMEEEGESDAEEKEMLIRLAQLRAAPVGAQLQQQFVAEEKRNKSISKYATGTLRAALEGDQEKSALAHMPSSSAAVVSDPGTMLGEEVLLYDPKDFVAARCSYTVRADQDCLFYVVDITVWKQLTMCFGQQAITQIVNDHLQRRARLVVRTATVAKKLDRRKRELVKSELNKGERQQIRFPWSGGSFGPRDLEDVDGYLQLVFNHRRGPRDEKNLPTLSILEETKMGPLSPNNGPAVNRLLKVVNEMPPAAFFGKKHTTNLGKDRKGLAGRRVSLAPSVNPMGDSITAAQQEKYAASVPPDQSVWATSAELSRISSQPSGTGIFHQTELDVEVTLMQSSSAPTLPVVMGAGTLDCSSLERDARTATALSAGVSESEEITVRPEPSSSQLSSSFLASQGLARPSTSGVSSSTGAKDSCLAGSFGASSAIAMQGTAIVDVDVGRMAVRKPDQKSKKKDGNSKIARAFGRAVAGKSVIVLTDKSDVRKSIMRSVMSSELQLCFVKSQTDIWHRLLDLKDKFDAFIWDLAKSQTSVAPLLKSIRQHERYSDLPIIVLSGEQELPDMVRESCSYVIFHPLSASIFREALLWCFDRRTLLRIAKHDEAQSHSIFEVGAALNVAKDAWPPSLSFEHHLSEARPAPQLANG